jgi:hypothetical protein
MPNSCSFPPSARRWKAAYRAAVIEPNRHTIPKAVFEAENAILARTRELCEQSGVEAEIERIALDDALCSLRTLRYAAENTTGAGREARFLRCRSSSR